MQNDSGVKMIGEGLKGGRRPDIVLRKTSKSENLNGGQEIKREETTTWGKGTHRGR